MMWIGTLALIGFPGLRRLSSARTRSSRRPTPRTTRSTSMRSGCGIARGRADRLLFRPADLAHLPRRAARRPRDHAPRPREPAGDDRAADRAGGRVRSSPAGSARAWSSAEGDFWAGAIFYGEHNHVLRRHARGAVLGEAGAVPGDGDRPRLLLGLLHPPAGPAGAQIAAAAGPINRLRSTTSGTSTSSTTSCSCARPRRWATALWRGGDVGIIDRFGPDGVAALDAGHGPPRGAAADRLRLPLRLRHADRRRGPGQLVSLS